MTDRPYIGPIPASSIDRAALSYPDEEDVLRYCIREMDGVYLEIARRDPDAPKVDRSQKLKPGMLSQWFNKG